MVYSQDIVYHVIKISRNENIVSLPEEGQRKRMIKAPSAVTTMMNFL